jgi:hypothetical protein
VVPTTGTTKQVTFKFAFLKYELKFSGSTSSDSSVDRNFVGTSAQGKRRQTDGQVWGGPFISKRVAFDVSVYVSTVDPNANRTSAIQVPVHVASHLSTRMQGPDRQSRRKLTSTNSYASSLVSEPFVTIIFTTSGAMG